MTNFETNDNRIKDALNNKIISQADYNAYYLHKAYKQRLQKSLQSNTLVKSDFDNKMSLAGDVHWERDFSSPTLRFKLHGAHISQIDESIIEGTVKSDRLSKGNSIDIANYEPDDKDIAFLKSINYGQLLILAKDVVNKKFSAAAQAELNIRDQNSPAANFKVKPINI